MNALVSVAIAGDAQAKVKEKEDELNDIETRLAILEAKVAPLETASAGALSKLNALCVFVSISQVF